MFTFRARRGLVGLYAATAALASATLLHSVGCDAIDQEKLMEQGEDGPALEDGENVDVRDAGDGDPAPKEPAE